MRCMRMGQTALTSAVLALAACTLQPVQRPTLPPPDHVVPAWYLGIPVVMRAFELMPEPATREADIPARVPYRQVVSYIVGVVDDSIGASPNQRIPLPDGSTVEMPAHQGVLVCLHAPDTPALGIAYSVIPGPAANRYNLRVDPMPEHSVIGAPLATYIKIGPTWVALNSHTAIEYGLRKSLLRLSFFGANPVAWATPEWDDNYPYAAGMNVECDQPARAPREYVTDRPGAFIPAH